LSEFRSICLQKPAAQLDANSVRAKLELAKNAKLEATKRKLQEGYQESDNGMRAAAMGIGYPSFIVLVVHALCCAA
jgi:hypothetical protein